MSKKDLLSTYLRRGTALVLAASVAGIAGITQAGPTKGGTLTVGLETDVRGFDTVKGGVYGISGRTVAGALEDAPIDVLVADRLVANDLAIDGDRAYCGER